MHTLRVLAHHMMTLLNDSTQLFCSFCMPSKDHKIPQKLCSLIFFNGRTYQEQKKDLGNEECILFMVQKYTNKVRLLKSENVQNLEMDT